MGLFDSLNKAVANVFAPGNVVIKSGRYSKEIPYETIKGKTLRDVVRENAEYLQIDAEAVNFAEKVSAAPLDSAVEPGTQYRPQVDRVQLTVEVEPDSEYRVDISRGEKGKVD
jgi:hypothetical protein